MSRNSSVFVIVLGLVLAALLPLFGKGETDFLAYWSSSRLLATGGNPYDPDAVRELELNTRPQRLAAEGRVIQVWNPPWLLLTLLPLGFLPFDWAVRVWAFFNTVSVGIALAVSWNLLPQLSDQRGMFLTLGAGFLFAATVLAINLGQITALVLLELALSAQWLQSGRTGRAGVALFLTTIKPHLTYLVLLLVIIWALRYRHWRLLSMMMATGLLAGTVMWFFSPDWGFDYLKLMMTLPYSALYTSTLSSLVEVTTGFNGFRFAWLLVLPSVFPLLQVIERQGWLTAINLALLISIPLAPYGFGFDQIVLLPAIVQIVAWLQRREFPVRWVWVVGSALAGINLVVLFWMLTLPVLPAYWLAWVPLALLGVYMLAWRQLSIQPVTPV